MKTEVLKSWPIVLLSAFVGFACASPARRAADKELAEGVERTQLRTAAALIPATLRFANCQKPGHSFAALDLEKIGACLRAQLPPTEVVYRLRRRADSWLELEDGETVPECLRATLAKIPVPREVMFQTVEEGRLICYNAALDPHRDEVLGAKVPFKGQWRLTVKLPLETPPTDEAATLRWLTTWALTPIWKETGEQPRVEVVADAVCRRCLNDSSLVPDHPNAPIPETWPPAQHEEPDFGY